MDAPEFHSYHTVILLSNLDFVALDNEHIHDEVTSNPC